MASSSAPAVAVHVWLGTSERSSIVTARRADSRAASERPKLLLHSNTASCRHRRCHSRSGYSSGTPSPHDRPRASRRRALKSDRHSHSVALKCTRGRRSPTPSASTVSPTLALSGARSSHGFTRTSLPSICRVGRPGYVRPEADGSPMAVRPRHTDGSTATDAKLV